MRGVRYDPAAAGSRAGGGGFRELATRIACVLQAFPNPLTRTAVREHPSGSPGGEGTTRLIGYDVARAMALPVFGGMLIEPLTSFIVPTMYCAYMEFKMRAGLKDKHWVGVESQEPTVGRQEHIAA